MGVIGSNKNRNQQEKEGPSESMAQQCVIHSTNCHSNRFKGCDPVLEPPKPSYWEKTGELLV